VRRATSEHQDERQDEETDNGDDLDSGEPELGLAVPDGLGQPSRGLGGTHARAPHRLTNQTRTRQTVM
jgi:hypothetical protein